MSAHATNYNILQKVFFRVENILRARVNVSLDIIYIYICYKRHKFSEQCALLNI